MEPEMWRKKDVNGKSSTIAHFKGGYDAGELNEVLIWRGVETEGGIHLTSHTDKQVPDDAEYIVETIKNGELVSESFASDIDEAWNKAQEATASNFQQGVNDEIQEGVKEVKVEDATLIVKVPKDQSDNARKEIRHRLDCSSHSIKKGTIHHVSPEYNMKTVIRDEHIEFIITHLDATIRMDKDISDYNVGATCRWVLDCSASVISVGGFNLKEPEMVKMEDE